MCNFEREFEVTSLKRIAPKPLQIFYGSMFLLVFEIKFYKRNFSIELFVYPLIYIL